MCHAIRTTDKSQGSFIGGGAIAVAVDRIQDFFPHVYNEDWFFFFNSLLKRRVAVGGTMAQARYNPFASSERAKREEFGDTLAEGLFALLGQRASDHEADDAFWERFIKERWTIIVDTIADKRAAGEPARVLKAARQANSWVRPEDVLAYLDHWRQDMATWRGWYEGLPAVGDVVEALNQLDVTYRVYEPAGDSAPNVTSTEAAVGAIRTYVRLLRSPRRVLEAAAQVARPPR